MIKGEGVAKTKYLNECLNKYLDKKTLGQTLKVKGLKEKGGIMIKEKGSWLRRG